VEIVRGDILDAEILGRAVSGMDSVIHLAGLLHITNPPASLRSEYERVNVLGTQMVVRACEAASVSRVVYLSTIAVYGAGNRGVMTESDVPTPDTWYGETKLLGEHAVLSVRDSSGRPIGTVLRLAAVYGSRIKGNYLRLVRALRNRRYMQVGRGDNRRALVYDKDVGLAAVLAAEHSAAAGQVFNVSDGTSPTLAEVVGHICAALGRPAPRFFIPVMPVRWAISVTHAAASAIGVSVPVTPSTLVKYVEDIRVDSSKIREMLGFRPVYDQASGWREAVAEMRFTELSSAVK
jgi:UDP-glucose 4-epimerase